MARYVALLRGINVGGNNIIPMVELRHAFGTLGFTDVATYIQSGNVVFTAGRVSTARLTSTIEDGLSRTFDYAARVVVLSAATVREVITQAPPGFGSDPTAYRYDVLYLKPPLQAAAVIAPLTPVPEVDAVDHGDHALYFRRLIARATQSHLNKLVSMPVYQQLTIRNWNTTQRLMAMLDQP
jgi:uncharacterized protein (DUF1697 family)